jgi:hypothetical protein
MKHPDFAYIHSTFIQENKGHNRYRIPSPAHKLQQLLQFYNRKMIVDRIADK